MRLELTCLLFFFSHFLLFNHVIHLKKVKNSEEKQGLPILNFSNFLVKTSSAGQQKNSSEE